MAKYLFVVPPFFGHISPVITVGVRLIEMGHDVRWTGLTRIDEKFFPAENSYIHLEAEYLNNQDEVERILAMQDQGPNLSVFEAAVLATEGTAIPFAKIMMSGIERLIREFSPDVIVNDCLALAGGLAAFKHGIPYATTIPVPPNVMGDPDTMPKIVNWHLERVRKLQCSVGIETERNIVHSEELNVIFTSKEFSGMKEVPDSVKFVGPVQGLPQEIPFEWELLKNIHTPIVYITIGTLLHDIRKAYFEKIVEAFGNMDVTFIAATDPGILEQWPDNFIVKDFVPQTELMKHVDAVICHGGFNTVNDTIMHGLPILITPIAYDHFHTANLITRAGCGKSIKYKRIKIKDLQDALIEILSIPAFREAAKGMMKTFIEAGGIDAAAGYFEDFYKQNKNRV